MPLIVVPTTYEGPQMFLNARQICLSFFLTAHFRVGDDTSDHLLVSKFKLAPQKKIMPMTFNDVQEIAAVIHLFFYLERFFFSLVAMEDI